MNKKNKHNRIRNETAAKLTELSESKQLTPLFVCLVFYPAEETGNWGAETLAITVIWIIIKMNVA